MVRQASAVAEAKADRHHERGPRFKRSGIGVKRWWAQRLLPSSVSVPRGHHERGIDFFITSVADMHASNNVNTFYNQAPAIKIFIKGQDTMCIIGKIIV